MSFNELINNNLTNKILNDTLHGCDDGELFFEDTINESFLFDDNVLKNSSFSKTKGFWPESYKQRINRLFSFK